MCSTRVRKHYSEREMVELTVLVGAYMMHNRVFTALGSTSSRKRTEGRAVPRPPVIVVEDDPFTRLIPLVLDPNADEERRAAFADFMSHRRAGFRRLVRARARKARRASIRPRCGMVASEEEMRANLKDCRRAGGGVVPRRPRRSRRRAEAQGGAEIRHRAAQHRRRGLRRQGHQASHVAPPRQHLLRRARLRADADAGAQARRTRWARHASSASRPRPARLPAVPPPPHARRQLRPRSAAPAR